MEAALVPAGEAASSSHQHAYLPRRVTIPRNEIPLDLLVARHDPHKYPSSMLTTREQTRQARRNADWASKRERLLALAAAGVHVVMFMYNLAFWGDEGMPPDRWVGGVVVFPSGAWHGGAPRSNWQFSQRHG
jgi:hypothetical protein